MDDSGLITHGFLQAGPDLI